MRTEERLREQLAAANQGIIHFEHEGEHVRRWLTGGLAPSISVTFHHEKDRVICRCPSCKQEIGWFDSDYSERVPDQISAIRYTGADHTCS